MARENDVIAITSELIKYQSITPLDAGIYSYIQNFLPNFRHHIIENEGVKNLFSITGKGEKHLTFLGHIDVVTPGENWKFGAFQPMVENGILYGRGAVDMKGAVAAFMLAAKNFLKDKNEDFGQISIALSACEEGDSSNGTPKIIEWLQQNNINPNFCLTGEPTSNLMLGDMIKIGRRGSINFILKMNGAQGHVAYPHLVDNPITNLVKVLDQLKSYNFNDKNENFDQTNLEITSIDTGNKATNVIPASITARFNIRFNNEQTKIGLVKLVEDICSPYQYELSYSCDSESFIGASPMSETVKSLQKIISKTLNVTALTSTTGGTSDARFFHKICETIEFGLLNKTAHKVDENVSIIDLQNLTLIYKEFLDKFFA